MYPVFRPLLFRFDAEWVHDFTLRLLALAGSLPPLRVFLRRIFSWENPEFGVHAFGLDFPNVVGLAAGYDKDGRGMHGLACLGFSHIELGTVTPLSQPGNPRPRIFRLPEDRALINRMGFPNDGSVALLRRLSHGKPRGIVLGINLGKGVDTPIERAVEDYVNLVKIFYPHGDYLALNISSPNTIGLRRLQAREHLEGLLTAVSHTRAELQMTYARYVPLLAKLSPDLTTHELEDAVGVIQEAGMDGVIAVNTTIERMGLKGSHQGKPGGLSGAPLRKRSTEIIHAIARMTHGRLPIIGVGGVFSAEDAREKLEAGATLLQVYTGLVYHGPGLVRSILKGLHSK